MGLFDRKRGKWMEFDRVEESAVADILSAIGAPPNRREEPLPGDKKGRFDFWFDGGACEIVTGYSRYEFATGTTATVSTTPGLNVRITFADGRGVSVSQYK